MLSRDLRFRFKEIGDFSAGILRRSPRPLLHRKMFVLKAKCNLFAQHIVA